MTPEREAEISVQLDAMEKDWAGAATVEATPDGGWLITKTGPLTEAQARAAVDRAYDLAAEAEALWAPLTEGF